VKRGYTVHFLGQVLPLRTKVATKKSATEQDIHSFMEKYCLGNPNSESSAHVHIVALCA
jgi:hypothetical protein